MRKTKIEQLIAALLLVAVAVCAIQALLYVPHNPVERWDDEDEDALILCEAFFAAALCVCCLLILRRFGNVPTLFQRRLPMLALSLGGNSPPLVLPASGHTERIRRFGMT